MKIDNVSFPYPVLGINDDIRPTLEETRCDSPTITIEGDRSNFYVNVDIKLENEDILNYIKNGDAEYSVEASCQSTLFRLCRTSDVPTFSFPIEKSRLNGKLTFETFVVAKRDIVNYQNKGLNPDYAGHKITIKKGELLVAYKPTFFPLDLDLRNVRAPKSFMAVRKNPNEQAKLVEFDLESPKIQILLPAAQYETFHSNELAKKGKDSLKASLFLNALTYALLHYQEYREKDYVWVRTLEFRLCEESIKTEFDLEDIFDPDNDSDTSAEIFKLAQAMLNTPYGSLFDKLVENNPSIEPIINS